MGPYTLRHFNRNQLYSFSSLGHLFLFCSSLAVRLETGEFKISPYWWLDLPIFCHHYRIQLGGLCCYRNRYSHLASDFYPLSYFYMLANLHIPLSLFFWFISCKKLKKIKHSLIRSWCIWLCVHNTILSYGV